MKELPPSPSKAARTVVSELCYVSNQEKAQEKLNSWKQKQKFLSRKYIETHWKYERYDENLKEEELVSSHGYKLLMHNFIDVFKLLFENQGHNAKLGDKHSKHYREEVKQFAMILHYCSP